MAIAAQFEELPGLAGKPREPRRKLRLEAQGALASGTATSVLVHNISATGLLIESAMPLSIGEQIDVDLPHAGLTSAKVVWTSGRLFGCEFGAPVSSAALSAAELRSTVRPETGTAAQPEPHADESFGARLHRLRKERGLTLSQIADRLGVSKPTVWAWERGKARPVASRLEALADILGLPRSELLPRQSMPGVQDLLARSREQIAEALGTSPDKIRILIEP